MFLGLISVIVGFSKRQGLLVWMDDFWWARHSDTAAHLQYFGRDDPVKMQGRIEELREKLKRKEEGLAECERRECMLRQRSLTEEVFLRLRDG